MLLDMNDALVCLIDVQANHYPHVFDGPATLERMVRLVRAARVLEVPVLWTEHYARAFGSTLPALQEAMEGLEPIHKLSFGCFGEPDFAAAVQASGRRTLYLVGAETHICIQQTALVALEQGLGVVLVADALTARGQRDHDIALQRMQHAGAVVTTWEATVYEWMRHGKHPKFKQILPLVKA